jgi:hypothetical protein
MSPTPLFDATPYRVNPEDERPSLVTSTVGYVDGAHLRDAGVSRIDSAPDVDAWRFFADRAIEKLAAAGEPFDAEDVRELAGDPPHGNAMGARFLRAAKRGLITRAGFRQARRPSSHAHVNPTWRGTRQC